MRILTYLIRLLCGDLESSICFKLSASIYLICNIQQSMSSLCDEIFNSVQCDAIWTPLLS